MALYGVDFYGASRYGPRVYLDFDASPLRALPNGRYGRLSLSWSTPVGEWSVLRLVRNSFGVPVTHDDGVVLVDSSSGPAEPVGTRTASVRSYTDTPLAPGSFQYYAIFVYVPGVDEWTRAASTTALVLKDYGYTNRLWELTPSIYRTQTGSLLDGDNETLKTFYGIFGASLDHLRGEYDSLLQVNNPDQVSGNLLPLMAKQYGQFFEPELGMKQMRRLLRETVYLYRNKGTIPGIEGFVSAVTGYGATVKPLKNLVLDYNDSSFEESIGRWAATGATLTRYVPDGSINAATVGGEMRDAGILRVVGTGTSAVLTLGNPANMIGEGIPVTAGQAYSFSFYSRAGTTLRSVQGDISWYDKAGAFLSTTAGTTAANAVGSWTRYTACSNKVAPTGAVYATLVLRLPTTAVGEVHYFDALQLEPGAAVTEYVDARLIDIVTTGTRINVVTNPNFETNATGWTGATRTTSFFRSGTAGGTATFASAGQTAYITATTVPGTTYIGSLWVRGSGTVAVQAHNGTAALATDTPVALSATWVRKSVVFTATTTTTRLGLVASGAGTSYIDDVLLETGTVLQDYFDGSTHAGTGESLWEGTANASKSHYYPQRRAKNFRINALLPEYTPMGSSFRVLYAQP